jgi:transcriptional regulator with XRE-family HTH domain
MNAKGVVSEESRSESLTARPGSALRALRKRNNWTLAEVSRRTGLTVPTLSKIENDRISLTYDKLVLISEALGLDIAQLFRSPVERPDSGPSEAFGRRCIVRRGEGRSIETQMYGHLYLASDLLNKRFVPMVVECRARSLQEFGELIHHEGEEFAYVLEGTLVIHTDVYAPAVLEMGDAIYFDSRIGHAYLTGGQAPCRVLAISSKPEPMAVAHDLKKPAPERAEIETHISSDRGRARSHGNARRK